MFSKAGTPLATPLVLALAVAAFSAVVALALVLGGSGTGLADTSVPCPTVSPGPTNIPGGPTKTPSPTGTPCPKPTITPTPTVNPKAVFVNETDQPMGFLHIQLFPSKGILGVSENPPGCEAPTLSGGFEYLEMTWSSACIDPGETVAVDLTSEFVTVVGHFFAPEVPAQTFINEEDFVANALRIDVDVFVKDVRILENPSDCPAPSIEFQITGLLVDWQERCVGPGDAALLHIVSFVPVTSASHSWVYLAAGNVDCDGAVSSIDAALILQLDVAIVSSLACQELGDVNGDGNVDAVDGALVLQFVVGLIPGLPT